MREEGEGGAEGWMGGASSNFEGQRGGGGGVPMLGMGALCMSVRKPPICHSVL